MCRAGLPSQRVLLLPCCCRAMPSCAVLLLQLPADAVRLLRKMLELNPAKRISAIDALFVSPQRNPSNRRSAVMLPLRQYPALYPPRGVVSGLVLHRHSVLAAWRGASRVHGVMLCGAV
jgi:hypothetical protein